MSGIGPGSRIAGRYFVLEELGRGGMGVVYLARDEREERDVAVKVLREAPQGEAARRLQREARAMGALDPQGVARVFEVGETPEGELFLVMEYIRGRTLRAIERRGRVARSEALRIVKQVAATLGQAHRAGLVHRDVKPDNIMVCEDGRVVLLDFGIVKRLQAGEDTVNLSTQLTSAGSVIGTPAYLSPEQALGRAVGPETDQFALAVTAFELLTGKLPWTATELTTILAQVLAETPLPASHVDARLQPSFDAVLSRALAKSAAGRFATIDDFASALEAAERGEYVPFEVSETVMAPSFVQTGQTGRTAPGFSVGDTLAPRGRRRWLAALALLAAAAGAAVVATRSRAARPTAAPAIDDVEATLSALAGPEARLACPILEARGVTDVGERLAAATATLTCARAAWFLGGRHDRVLPPAALLDVPRQPTAGFADPYASPEQREKTIAFARARAAAYVDGVVTHDAGAWLIELVLRTPDGKVIARGEGRDSAYFAAIEAATTALWRTPLARRAIDPEIARWTSFPDTDVGLAYTDLALMDSTHDCASIGARGRELGDSFFVVEKLCQQNGAGSGADAGAPVLDESSPERLVTSASAVVEWQVPLASEETRRVAAKLDDLLRREPSSVGRARIADLAGVMWMQANEPEHAQGAFLRALREDPLLHRSWQLLVIAAASTGSATSASSVAAAWFPFESTFLDKAASLRGDELEARLREARLAYLIEPEFERAKQLGRALAEAGRDDEVRAVASTTLESSDQSRILQSFLMASLDLHGAKLERGIARLEDAGDVGMTDLVVAASVAGRLDDVATRWATRFLAYPEERAGVTARAYDAPMVLCMHARRDVATRCLDRVSRLGRAGVNWWKEGDEALLEGAKRYAAGDVRGAVASWRPLVAVPTVTIVRMLPSEAFERAGEPDLAARLDARKMPYTFIAGVSDAAPREAKRALAAGDVARARTLAQKAVEAWEVADVAVPAVAAMRRLLAPR